MTAAWEAKNEHDKAITYLDEAIRLGPNNQKVVKRKSLVMQKRQWIEGLIRFIGQMYQIAYANVTLLVFGGIKIMQMTCSQR